MLLLSSDSLWVLCAIRTEKSSQVLSWYILINANPRVKNHPNLFHRCPFAQSYKWSKIPNMLPGVSQSSAGLCSPSFTSLLLSTTALLYASLALPLSSTLLTLSTFWKRESYLLSKPSSHGQAPDDKEEHPTHSHNHEKPQRELRKVAVLLAEGVTCAAAAFVCCLWFWKMQYTQ